MAFFLVDDQFHSHPKPRKAGLAAVGLWSVSGSWSQAHKQEGFVPDWYVHSWPSGRRLAAELVKARMWVVGDRDGETGWWFHDWLDIHPTADEIEQQRIKNRERQRERRRRLREGKPGGNTA